MTDSISSNYLSTWLVEVAEWMRACPLPEGREYAKDVDQAVEAAKDLEHTKEALQGMLEACEQHVKILQEQRTTPEPPASTSDEAARREQLADRLSWPQPSRGDLDAASAIIRSTIATPPPRDDYFDKYSPDHVAAASEFLCKLMCDYADRGDERKASLLGTGVDFLSHWVMNCGRSAPTKVVSA
jgi:hypothetical protein